MPDTPGRPRCRQTVPFVSRSQHFQTPGKQISASETRLSPAPSPAGSPWGSPSCALGHSPGFGFNPDGNNPHRRKTHEPLGVFESFSLGRRGCSR